MNLNRKDLLLYAITDSRWLNGERLEDKVRDAVNGGATFVQLREKDATFDEFVKIALKVKSVTDELGIPFVINDNIAVALEVDADGVHVGQSDMNAKDVRKLIGNDKILGVSAKNVDEALLAKENGADYIGVGAMFATDSKDDADKVSFDMLDDIINSVDIPVVAIGGIDESNIKEFENTNIDGVCVISAIFASDDILKSTRNLKNLLMKHCFKIKNMNTALTIAGSDCSGGAGIQADLKTFTAHKVYGMSVISAITSQNTCGVRKVMNVDSDIIEDQIDAVFEDIYPDAVKIGMVSSSQIIDVITKKINMYKPKNVVLDTVMISTSGHRLLDEDAMEKLINELIPLSDIITPNIPEAQCLCGFEIKSKDDMLLSAREISKKYVGYILIKGGHLNDCADDLLYKDGNAIWLRENRVDTNNTHGTGCTLSSAIASNLANGYDMIESVKMAKKYVNLALRDNLDLGLGSGPINHCFNISN